MKKNQIFLIIFFISSLLRAEINNDSVQILKGERIAGSLITRSIGNHFVIAFTTLKDSLNRKNIYSLTDYCIVILKVTNDGQIIWRTKLQNDLGLKVIDLKIDSVGFIYVLSELKDSNTQTFMNVSKIGKTGNLIIEQKMDIEPSSLFISNNNIFVSGSFPHITDNGYKIYYRGITCFDSHLSLIWKNEFDKNGSLNGNGEGLGYSHSIKPLFTNKSKNTISFFTLNMNILFTEKKRVYDYYSIELTKGKVLKRKTAMITDIDIIDLDIFNNKNIYAVLHKTDTIASDTVWFNKNLNQYTLKPKVGNVITVVDITNENQQMKKLIDFKNMELIKSFQLSQNDEIVLILKEIGSNRIVKYSIKNGKKNDCSFIEGVTADNFLSFLSENETDNIFYSYRTSGNFRNLLDVYLKNVPFQNK